MARQGRLAEDLRAGLEVVEPVQPIALPTPIDPLDQRWFGKPVRHHVKECGQVFALICFLFTFVAIRKEWNIATTWGLFSFGCLWLAMGYLFPRQMHPIWKGWMAFGEKIGAVMSMVVLSISWGLMVVPTGLILRLIGKDVMNMKFRVDVPSYWDDRDPKLNDFQLLKKQF